MSSPTKQSEKPSPPEGSCHYYVVRKKRYCRFHPAKDANFCAEHSSLFQPDVGKKRVLCPYNSKHTCYETKMNHHMKKCPSRPMEMPPYYSEGINSGNNDGETVPEPKATVVSEPLDVIEGIIEQIERLHKEHVGRLKEEILSHPCLNEELQMSNYGTSALRQRKQQASLIGQMEGMKMLKENTCFLEMGAGKGQMSHWLHSAVQDKSNIGFVLIERSHVRNKMDNLHREEGGGNLMERVRIDIEHLKLDQVPTIENHERKVVAFGKHLCGGATDLALRCVVETLPNSLTGKEASVKTSCNSLTDEEGFHTKRLKSDIKALSGVCIAMCCHHRCSWTSYVGKAFFRACGFSAKDFQIISSMSSWATCAWKGWSSEKKGKKDKLEKEDTRTADDNLDNLENNTDVVNDRLANKDSNISDINSSNTNLIPKKDDDTDNTNKSSHKEVTADENTSQSQPTLEDIDEEHTPPEGCINTRIQDKLSGEERERIGRKCKQLIDYGRVQYLRDHDMSSCLKIYIEEFYTPENVVLLATS